MEITHDMIEKLARLSKLEFSEQEQIQLQTDLQNMLQFVNQLQEVNTVDVSPLLHITQHKNILREDLVTSTFTREEALQNAPLKDDAFFKVPKVIHK